MLLSRGRRRWRWVLAGMSSFDVINLSRAEARAYRKRPKNENQGNRNEPPTADIISTRHIGHPSSLFQ